MFAPNAQWKTSNRTAKQFPSLVEIIHCPSKMKKKFCNNQNLQRLYKTANQHCEQQQYVIIHNSEIKENSYLKFEGQDMDLRRIWAIPISFPWLHIWIISTHTFTSERPRTKPRPIQSSAKWPATSPSTTIRGWRVSISTRISPTTKFTAAQRATWMVQIRTVMMICPSMAYGRTRNCSNSISWKKKSQCSIDIRNPQPEKGQRRE